MEEHYFNDPAPVREAGTTLDFFIAVTIPVNPQLVGRDGWTSAALRLIQIKT